MKCTLRNVLIALATFLFGIASHLIFYRQPAPDLQPNEVRIAAHVESDSPPPPLREKSEFVFDYNPAAFNPRGTYRILGPKPREFRNFDCLAIAVGTNNNGTIWGDVIIATYSGAGYDAPHIISALVSEQGISLVAEPFAEDDFGYRFEGEFLRQGDCGVQESLKPS